MGTENFISLKNGMIVNLNAVAYIRPIGGLDIKNNLRGVQIVYPSSLIETEEGIEQVMATTLSGDEAEEFLSILSQRGVDIGHIQEARKDLGKGAFAAIARATAPTNKPAVNVDLLSRPIGKQGPSGSNENL